jgi:hypothetical protein
MAGFIPGTPWSNLLFVMAGLDPAIHAFPDFAI